VIDGLLAAGFKVAHLARGGRFKNEDIPPEWTGKPIKLFTPPNDDANGYRYLGYLLDVELEFEKIDCIFYIADPESIRGWRSNVQARAIDVSKPMPTVTYGPTEGGPLLKPDSTCLSEIIATGGVVSTYTQFSADVMTSAIKRAFVKGAEIPDFQIRIIPHGADHAKFRVLPKSTRESIRNKFQWNDKIVVMGVARNGGRKMWPNLFKAIALLKDQYPNIVLYAHTTPFEGFFLGGHNLPEIAANLEITNHVIYPDHIPDPWHGVPYENLIAAYNAADLFVSNSGCEGWNLCVSEAAACGLPVACTAYSGMWEQAQDYAIPMTPDAWVTHSCGSDMAVVTPEQIAQVIEHYLVLCPEDAKPHIQRGLEVASRQTWKSLMDAAPIMVQDAINNSAATTRD
jgi:glycosyltransferase involved in cell wall biosynthesis